jgi:Family of unknown function (DUF5709)
MTSTDGTSPSEEYSDGPELLSPEESLDDDELDGQPDEGYSPVERPLALFAWGTTAREAATPQDLAHRLAGEVPEEDDLFLGDGIGDTVDTDGEPIDDQVGDLRSGRLVIADIDPADPGSDFTARDVGIDGAGASAEEAAMHTIPDEFDFILDDDDDLAGDESSPQGRPDGESQ